MSNATTVASGNLSSPPSSGGLGILSSVGEFISLNILLLFITILLSGLGVYLSIGTHVFQVKSGLRESLEQLDDILIGKNSKVNVILYDFNYTPLRNIIPFIPSNKHSTLEFRVYVLNDQNIGGAGTPKEIEYFIKDLDKSNIMSNETVTEIVETDYSMQIRLESIDTVTCRNVSLDTMIRIIEAN